MNDSLTIHEVEQRVQKRIDVMSEHASNIDNTVERQREWRAAITQFKALLAWIDKRIEESV